MKRLPLDLMRYSKDAGRLSRNYNTIKIEHFDESIDLSCLEEIGDHVQRLLISHSIFKNPRSFQDIFKSLTLLNEIELRRVLLESTQDCAVVHGRCRLTLKKLELVLVDHKLLNLLPNFQVLNLEMTDATNRTDSESLVSFLSLQHKLESLTIENLSDDASVLFTTDNSSKIKFKLKKLSTLFSHTRDLQFFETNFVLFLKRHEDTLKKMKVEGSLSQGIYKCIVTRCQVLNELELRVSELPQESSFYDYLKPNQSLRTLKLNGTITKSNLEGFKGMLEHYPNLLQISLADTDAFVANDVFHLMSVKLPKMNHLSVLNLHDSFTPTMIFPSLKFFSIRILNELEQWKIFITRNDSLEALNVGWVKRDQFTPRVIMEITNLLNMRHLKFGGRFIACKRIFDVIKIDYRHIRTLELMVANYEEIKNLKFIFPLDKMLWIPKCEYLDEGNDREPLND